jgi:hypothetical protein
MMYKKNNILTLIFLMLYLIPCFSRAGEDENIEYEFILTDSCYSFCGRIKIRADAKCLLDLTFNFNHIRALVPDAKEVLLLDHDSDSCVVQYTFQKFLFFVNTSVWKRVLDKPERKVKFSLVSSENNLSIMPELLYSTGYYHVIQQNGYVVMEYFHECRVTEKSITRLYLNRLKDEAIKFMYRFSDYACEQCKCLSTD